jgi:hypothetical protein
VYSPPRRRARIVPPSPMTVAIEDETRLHVGYGVIANVSESGACIWTDSRLGEYGELLMRVSFGRLAEVHEITGIVVWESIENGGRGIGLRRFGVEWRDASPACIARLRELALQAIDGPVTPTGPLCPVRPSVSH